MKQDFSNQQYARLDQHLRNDGLIGERQQTDWTRVKKLLLGARLNPKQKSIFLQALNVAVPTPDWLNQNGWQVDNICTICGGPLSAQHCIGPCGPLAGAGLSMDAVRHPVPVKQQVSFSGKCCCYIDGAF